MKKPTEVNIQYDSMKFTGINIKEFSNFILNNYFTLGLNYNNNDLICFYDSDGIMMEILNDEWLLVNKNDNTHYYIVCDEVYNKIIGK